MADKRILSLGDLKEHLMDYEKELRESKEKKIKKFLKDGSEAPVESTVVGDAAVALDNARKALDKICEQATLAISVE